MTCFWPGSVFVEAVCCLLSSLSQTGFRCVCCIKPLCDVLMLHFSTFAVIVMFQSSIVGNRQCRVSAVEPGSLLQVVYTRTDSVSWGSWHLSCHYPVSALIKWLAHRREAFMKMPDWVQHTHTHTQLSLSSLTLSSAADVHVLAITVLNSHLFILAAVPQERLLSTLCFTLTKCGNDLLCIIKSP